MSERKVLNKYYPPDFDPSKIPRMKLPKNRQYTVRLMAPFNMRCVTCGEYIYKGKKFNARKEDVEGQDYLGIRIYRFYIKCTRCLQEISFKTDPQNTDYEIEAGATRNFMALKLAEEQAQKEEDERIEDESTNPMKLLENRTKQSKQEIELLESLEELRDLNRRQRTIDYDQMLNKFDTKEMERQVILKQEEEDEKYIRSVFGAGGSKQKVIEEIIEDDGENKAEIGEETSEYEPARKVAKLASTVVSSKAQDTVASSTKPEQQACSASFAQIKKVAPQQSRSVGVINKKGGLSGLVRLKQATAPVGEVGEKKVEPSVSSSEGGTAPTTPALAGNGLSLLGSYSGTDSDSN